MVKRKKEKQKSLFDKSNIDPSKKNKGQKKERNEKEIKDQDEKLDVLSGYGDLGKDAEIKMADDSIKIMSPYILKDYRTVLELLNKFKDISKIKPEEVIDITLQLGFLSFKRKHPDITIEYLEENVDLEWSRKIMKVVMHYAGLDSLKDTEKKK